MNDPAYKLLLSTLVRQFASSEQSPSIDEIRGLALQLAPLLKYGGPIEPLVTEARENISHRLGVGVSLVLKEAGHDSDWVRKRDINWVYSDNYEKYLMEDGLPGRVVETLMQVSLKVASHLQDPLKEGRWDRRGLVIGHVQSGKTANYLGLVARAADAGYRFIVIVAGIHNNLRMQTQERVDAGFVGRVSSAIVRERLTQLGRTSNIGVGTYSGHPYPVTLTTTDSDFRKAIANTTGSALKDWSKPVVIVIKKNVSTLKALNGWLKDFNREVGQTQIADVPMLFIDDEADNASVNTNKPELSPTSTNKLIRETLSLFHKSSYVGYTATPFANIFINPDAYDQDTLKDLFPRHFIHCLDAPTNYFGADRLFLDEDRGRRHLRHIRDCEDVIPLKHSKDHGIDELPASLRKAIRVFFLVRAIRNLRGQTGKHASMLINVSRFTDVQKDVRRLVETYRTTLAEAIEANGALSETDALRNAHLRDLHATWQEEFSESDERWPEVQSQLHDAASSIRAVVVNSKSDEGLNYGEYAERGEALNVIAIGGLSLSRGLTLEGLAVSYMYRNTRMYDTLLQMGRWFGYRPGYEDLCRVWLSDESIGWYSHIAESTDELRDTIKEMNRVGASPEKFGLMVQSHPDALLVTAANKMRDAQELPLSISYDGKLMETYIVPDAVATTEQNIELYKALWDSLNSEHASRRIGSADASKPYCRVWRGVPLEILSNFLASFASHPDRRPAIASAIGYLRKTAADFPTGDIAFMSLKGQTASPLLLGDFRMEVQRRQAGFDKDGNQIRKPVAAGGYFVTSKHRVAGRGDESVGLTPEQVERAHRVAAEDAKPVSDRHYRHVDVRGRPLLMLHLLEITDPRDERQVLLQGAPAIGISFPHTGHYRTVEYVVNKVMLDQMRADLEDGPDEGDDFDREDMPS
ncbi:Z1 domain-containing protein [Hyphomonas sp.]|uniref:Z1 domain-containing protein n=1 Tax=Hyphomonas sp. TaxID=87 RepID=UPI00391B3DA9